MSVRLIDLDRNPLVADVHVVAEMPTIDDLTREVQPDGLDELALDDDEFAAIHGRASHAVERFDDDLDGRLAVRATVARLG